MAGVSYTSFAEWHRRANDESDERREVYAQFASEVARARAEALATLEDTFDQQVTSANGGNGDWRGTMSKLKVLYPEVWNVPDKHELTGANGGPVQVAAQVVEIPAQLPTADAWAVMAKPRSSGGNPDSDG